MTSELGEKNGLEQALMLTNKNSATGKHLHINFSCAAGPEARNELAQSVPEARFAR
jgi:hypothetical protein